MWCRRGLVSRFRYRRSGCELPTLPFERERHKHVSVVVSALCELPDDVHVVVFGRRAAGPGARPLATVIEPDNRPPLGF